MDNKITKRRLSDLFAYEWILLIVLCVAIIIGWELIYDLGAVKLKKGQDYKFYYDYTLHYGDNYNSLLNHLDVQDDLGYENGKTFSYEIQKIHAEGIFQKTDVLSIRLSAKEGDMLFTDDTERKIDGIDCTNSIAKYRVDDAGVPIMTLDDLLKSAKDYLTSLLRDGQTEIKAENLNPDKIKAGFEERLGGDNRFRSAEQKAMGLQLEKERLEKLCKDVSDFEIIMSLGDEMFFNYTRYSQLKRVAEAQEEPDQQLIDNYNSWIQEEIDNGRENARYGLMLGKLPPNGRVDVSKLFSIPSQTDDVSGNVVLMVFDFLDAQPELQFESISVINNIVRACSNVLDTAN